MLSGRVSGKASPSDLDLQRYMAHANSARQGHPDFVTFDKALVASVKTATLVQQAYIIAIGVESMKKT